MIETSQTIAICAPIERVWTYAHDINGWAKLMPGLQDCAIIDEDNSRWTLKVGVGGLVRTVKVFVRVDRWAGPDEVDFTYKLEGDPVNGGGTYRARSLGPGQTEIALGVRVNGEGPMAPMWEAMGKPLLPKFARAFAEQFKAEIELGTAQSGEAAEPTSAMTERVRKPTFFAAVFAWLRRLLGQANNSTK
jgi:carbon monoxide dehydrogenase subunit G